MKKLCKYLKRVTATIVIIAVAPLYLFGILLLALVAFFINLVVDW